MIDYIASKDLIYKNSEQGFDIYYKFYNFIQNTHEVKKTIYFNNNLSYVYVKFYNFINDINDNKYEDYATRKLKLILDKFNKTILLTTEIYDYDYIFFSNSDEYTNDISEFLGKNNYNLLTDIQNRYVYTEDSAYLYSIKQSTNSVLEQYLEIFYKNGSGIRLKKTLSDTNNNIKMDAGPANLVGLWAKVATFNGSWTTITPENYTLSDFSTVRYYNIYLKQDSFTSKYYRFNIKTCRYLNKIRLKFKNRFNVYEYYTFSTQSTSYEINDIINNNNYIQYKNSTNYVKILKIQSEFIGKEEEKIINIFMKSDFCIDYINDLEYVIVNSDYEEDETNNFNNYIFEIKMNKLYE